MPGMTWQQSSSSSHPSSSSTGSSDCGMDNNCGNNRRNINYYAYLEEQINLQAKKLTIDYLKAQGL